MATQDTQTERIINRNRSKEVPHCTSMQTTHQNKRTESEKQILSTKDLMMESFSVPKDTMRAVSDAIFQKQVLRSLSNINVKIDQLSEDFNRKKFQEDIPESAISVNNSIWDKFNFPLENIEHLFAVEEFLTDEENLKQFVSELTIVGGLTFKHMMKRLISKLFTNEIAMKYSWIGFKGKENFSLLNISKAMTSGKMEMGKLRRLK